MENELDNLIIDLKSDKKAQKRAKAFGRLKELLTSQQERERRAVQNVVENNDNLSLDNFFKAAHEGSSN